jgi:predicted amidohydrolase
MGQMRIAAFQRSPIIDDIDRLCDGLDHDLRWAMSAGVTLALFPEGYVLGHSYDPGTIVRRATSISNGALETVCGRIPANSPMVVIGGFEMRGTAILNSAFVIEAGTVVGRYAKAHPNEPGVAAGNEFPIFQQSGCRFGINICNDANYPDAAQAIADQHADLILYPLNNLLPVATADRWRTRSVENLRARARQTGCWIASADVTGGWNGRISHGCTAILNPAGEIVARVAEGNEGIALCDIPIMNNAR